MRIVIDTNVLISGLFFGGLPRKIIEATVEKRFTVSASPEIIEEYKGTVQSMIDARKGTITSDFLVPFINCLNIVLPESKITVCRDPDDNKFLECAFDSKSLYVVSGDKDLLSLTEYQGIKIVTVREFVDSLTKKVTP